MSKRAAATLFVLGLLATLPAVDAAAVARAPAVSAANVEGFADRFGDAFTRILGPLATKLGAVKTGGGRTKIVGFTLDAGGGKVRVEGLGIVLPKPPRFELTLQLDGVDDGSGGRALILDGIVQLDIVPYAKGKRLGLFRGQLTLGGAFGGKVDVRGEVNGTKVVALEVQAGSKTLNPTRKPATLLSYVSTVAGNGSEGFRDGRGRDARFAGPTGVAVDRDGNMYVADRDNGAVRKITPGGTVTTLAEGLRDPRDIGVDAIGDLLVTEGTYPDEPLVRVDTRSGALTPVVFNEDEDGQGYCGLNLPPCDGRSPLGTMTWPAGIDVQGSVAYVFEYAPPWIRVVLPDGTVTTVLRGNDGGRHGGTCGSLGVVGAGGADVAKGLDGDIYFVADAVGCYGVLVLRGNGTVEALAGNLDEYGNRDGVGNQARFFSPEGLVFDDSRFVFVADTGNNLIRQVDVVTRRVVRLAGCLAHTKGFDCDNTFGFRDGPMNFAQFDLPTGIATDQWGDLYVADDGNNAIRMIRVVRDPEEWAPKIDSFRPWALERGRTTTIEVHGKNLGLAETVALGPGVTADVRHAGSRLLYLEVTVAPDAGPGPRTLAITTPYGRASTPDNLSLEILDDSFVGATVETIAGTGTWSPAFQDGPAELSEIAFPAGMTTVDDDRLLVADPVEQRIRMIATYNGAAQEITELLLYAGTNGNVLGTILTALGTVGSTLSALGIANNLGSLAEDVIREQFVKPALDQMCMAADSPCDWISLPWAGQPLMPGNANGFRLNATMHFPTDVERAADGVFFVADPGNTRIRPVGLNPSADAAVDAPFMAFGTNTSNERPFSVAALAKDLAAAAFAASSEVKRLAMKNNGQYTDFAGVQDGLRCEPVVDDPRHPLGVPVGVDSHGGFTYVADILCQTIWRVDQSTMEVEDVRGETRVAGADIGPCSDGPVGLATFGAPIDLDVDADGNIWFVDAVCNSVRVIKDLAAPESEVAAQMKDWLDAIGGHLPDAVTRPAYDKIEQLDQEYLRTNRWWVLTVAGSHDGEAGFVDGPASDARFYAPIGITVRVRAGSTSVFISDAGNHRIRLLQIP